MSKTFHLLVGVATVFALLLAPAGSLSHAEGEGEDGVVGPQGEVGADFRLSGMGPDLNPDYDALYPAVAYNSQDNEYLVVWSGSDDVVGEYEIWGQRVNAATGAQIGADRQISFVGPPDDPDYDATEPDVAYNSEAHEYLVVWTADHYAEGDYEIFGRRVSAETGSPIGAMVRVSVMGPGTDPDYDGRAPAVAYNSQENEYLVVWEGDDDEASLVEGEFEIWARRLSASAELVGDTFRVSDMGGLGDADYDAFDPDVAYNSQDNEYMVVWEGDDKAYNRADDEFEIWGQRLNAGGGAMGAGDFRISSMGPSNDPDYDAFDPAVAYGSVPNQYLVVWEGENSTPDSYDILGQRLGANGSHVGSDDFYVSHAGVGPNSEYDALNPAAAYDRANNEYLVVWQDDEMGNREFEIWGQRVRASTGASEGIDTRLSDMGPEGEADHDAQTPAVAYSGQGQNEYMVAWAGDDVTDGEFEIWSQRFTGGYTVYLPLTLKAD